MNVKSLILLTIFPLIMWSCQAQTSSWYETKQEKKEVGQCDVEPCMNLKLDYVVFTDQFPNHNALNEELQRMLGQFLILDGKAVPKVLKKSIDAFESSFKDFIKTVPNSAARQYIAEGTAEIVLDTEKLKSIIVSMDLYTGGANGMNFYDALNVDAQTGQILQINDLVTDMEAFSIVAEKNFRKQFEIDENQPFSETSFFMDGSFFLSRKIAFTEEFCVILYDKYEAAVGAMGPIKLNIPMAEVQHLISNKYQD